LEADKRKNLNRIALEQVGGFLRVLLFPPPIEMDNGSPPSGIGSFGDFVTDNLGSQTKPLTSFTFK
jgi:hypothetical protein